MLISAAIPVIKNLEFICNAYQDFFYEIVYWKYFFNSNFNLIYWINYLAMFWGQICDKLKTYSHPRDQGSNWQNGGGQKGRWERGPSSWGKCTWRWGSTRGSGQSLPSATGQKTLSRTELKGCAGWDARQMWQHCSSRPSGSCCMGSCATYNRWYYKCDPLERHTNWIPPIHLACNFHKLYIVSHFYIESKHHKNIIRDLFQAKVSKVRKKICGYLLLCEINSRRNPVFNLKLP